VAGAGRKPIHPAAGVTIIPLACRLPGTSSDLPGDSAGRPQTPPYLVLHRMGFTQLPRSPGELVRSYRTVSPLPRPKRGGLLSVALAFASPRLHVMEHPALWCSDFPPGWKPGDRLACSDHEMVIVHRFTPLYSKPRPAPQDQAPYSNKRSFGYIIRWQCGHIIKLSIRIRSLKSWGGIFIRHCWQTVSMMATRAIPAFCRLTLP
jgi:hypothetical protein